MCFIQGPERAHLNRGRSMDKRLNVAFVWHMHQPLYKDPITNVYTLPWVLFHATKDYYDMAAVLEEFPDVHQTFNLVPCLIEQLEEYGSGKASDQYLLISRKTVEELTHEDKVFMLRNFFQANWDLMIRPFDRYWKLLMKRGTSNAKDEVSSVLRYFTDRDYLDLQVLFNLAWIDPHIRDTDKVLKSLVKKGAGYTEDDKTKLFAKQVEIVNMILPEYKKLMEAGTIEVSTTPYFHPIMPLLCDSYSAKEAMPNAVLPNERFMHPEDAAAQLRKGVELYEKTFGKRPSGIWPSEGSVSMEMLPVIAGEGIKWIATDEEILTNSLKRPLRRDDYGHVYDPFLYKPYSVDVQGRKVSMIFRDHVLSDLIGFDYAKMSPEAAASDMVSRLEHIENMLENPAEHIVSIILDGENAWEHFRNDGRDFLVALYTKLSKHPRLRCVTVSEFLDAFEGREELAWVYPGSWISHNFKIWIGHVEDNTAWDYIAGARDSLVKYQSSLTAEEKSARADTLKEAWDGIYAAEGSDWFWWYGEEHSSMSDEDFDSLFRRHIKKVYTLIGLEPPDSLEIPISSEEKGYAPPVAPTAFMKPRIDGDVTNYFEWLASGRIERQYYGSAMHKELQGSGLVESIHYGFSPEELFFRFDYLEELAPYAGDWSFTINFLHPRSVRVNATLSGTEASVQCLEKEKDGKWAPTGTGCEIASDRVVELSVPLDVLGATQADAGGDIRLFISINGGERGRERWPVKGFLIFQVPGPDFEQQNWIV